MVAALPYFFPKRKEEPDKAFVQFFPVCGWLVRSKGEIEMERKRNLVKGKILHEGEKYFVVVGDARYELPPDLVPENKIKPLSGKNVEVEFTDPVQHIVGVFGTGSIKPPRIICYIPPIDSVFRNPLIIDAIAAYENMNTAANRLLEEGVITKEIHAKLVGK